MPALVQLFTLFTRFTDFYLVTRNCRAILKTSSQFPPFGFDVRPPGFSAFGQLRPFKCMSAAVPPRLAPSAPSKEPKIQKKIKYKKKGMRVTLKICSSTELSCGLSGEEARVAVEEGLTWEERGRAF